MVPRGGCSISTLFAVDAVNASEVPSYLCVHMKKPLAKCFTLAGPRHLKQIVQAVDGVQSER